MKLSDADSFSSSGFNSAKKIFSNISGGWTRKPPLNTALCVFV